MTLTDIGVLFSIKVHLYCGTNFLSIKHVDVPKSISVWTSIVASLLYLTMIGTTKHGIGSKDKLGPFSLHDSSRFNLVVPTNIKDVYKINEMKALTYIYTPLGT
jgi:hypothetical protein